MCVVGRNADDLPVPWAVRVVEDSPVSGVSSPGYENLKQVRPEGARAIDRGRKQGPCLRGVDGGGGGSAGDFPDFDGESGTQGGNSNG